MAGRMAERASVGGRGRVPPRLDGTRRRWRRWNPLRGDRSLPAERGVRV